jgi:hypothetical protein
MNLEDEIRKGNVERFYTTCDKCGEPVPQSNDAVALDVILHADVLLIFGQPRHLLATENCPGSPSRAQYIEGQPRDERTAYPYNEELEPVIRDAYAKLQEL